jgi:hypothetical protein
LRLLFFSGDWLGSRQQAGVEMLLRRGEKLSMILIAAIFAVDVGIVLVRAIPVDWLGYVAGVAIGLAAISLGQFYRIVRPNERIALAATATGLFVLFTICASILNHSLLPIGGRRIDILLMWIDGLLGYSWPAAVEVAAAMPVVGLLLGVVYLSSLLQMIFVICLLGFSGRAGDLERFMFAGILAGLATIAIWAVMPSSGPSAYLHIPAETADKIRLVVGASYGAELNRLAIEGPALISLRDALGLIAFPSFHTVMACLAVWFTMGFPRVFPVFAVINILMLPAILVHGGHHLVDVFGGLAVFVAALVVARAFVSSHELDEEPKIQTAIAGSVQA